MNQIYRFTDWTSASKMKNQVNPRLSVDVGVIVDGDNKGYVLTVYDNITYADVYKFYIDYGAENTWCLTTNEAISMLNMIGFPCEFSVPTYDITERVREILVSMKDLGFTFVERRARPARIIFINEDGTIKFLDEVTRDYNYHDFWFLDPPTPVSIEGILNHDTSVEG